MTDRRRRGGGPFAAFVLGFVILAIGCGSIAPGSPAPTRSFPASSAPVPTTSPSSPSAAPSARSWTSVDLPLPADAAPALLGVAPFRGGYIAVGSIWGTCDRDQPPFDRGVIWTSEDGRTWALHDRLAPFAAASLRGIATDGSRLVAFGYRMPATAGGTRVSAAWASTDGLAWVPSTDPAPSVVAPGPHGFVGAIAVNGATDPEAAPSVSFVTSADAQTWSAASPRFDGWLGGRDEGSSLVGDQVLAKSGSGLLAIGSIRRATARQAAVVWPSLDGTTWAGPLLVAEDATPRAVVATGEADLVAVTSSADGENQAAIWRVTLDGSPAILQFTAPPGSVISQLFEIGGVVIAAGFNDIGTIAWQSADGGVRFGPIERGGPFDGRPTTNLSAILSTPAGWLAAGGEDGRPVVWLGG